MDTQQKPLVILVLIGLPGAGKTTFARSLKEYLEEKGESVWHLEYDATQTETYHVEETSWKSWREDIRRSVDNAIQKWRGDEFNSREKSLEMSTTKLYNVGNINHSVIIVDDNMYYPSMRYAWFQVAKKHRQCFAQLYLNCSLKTALLRNQARKGASKIDDSIIERMNSKLLPPNCATNLWEKHSLELCSDSDTAITSDTVLNSVQHLIEKSRTSPLELPIEQDMDSKEVQTARKVTFTNLAHQCDLILRNLVSQKISQLQSIDTEAKQTLALKALRVKSDTLKAIQCGQISLPSHIIDFVSDGNIGDVKAELEDFLQDYIGQLI